MRKTRPDDVLGNLGEAEQLKLCDLLTTQGLTLYDVRDIIAKPPPDGFSCSTSVSALSRYYTKNVGPMLIAKRQRAVSTAEAVAQEASKTPGRFDAATIDALKQKAFELAISPQVNPKDVKAIFSLVLKARDQDLEDRRVTLLEQQAAKAEQAEKVVKSEASPEEKQQQLRAIFGMS